MQDLNDDPFDALLSGHLSRELDGQVGRAGAAFQRPQRRYAMRIAAWGSLAAAAAIAMILLRPTPPVLLPVKPPDAVAVEYQVDSQTIDQGTVFLDDETPARQYVQRQTETARWVDPLTHSQMEMSEPHDQVLLVGLNTY